MNTVPVKADMSDWDQVHRAVQESRDGLGGFDIMINNSVNVVAGPFENHTKDDIDTTVHGSLTMMMYGAHAALEVMLPQGSGRSSTSGPWAAASSSGDWWCTTRASPG